MAKRRTKKHKSKVTIKPEEVKDQKLTDKDTKNSFVKEPKDGREQTKVKESISLESLYETIKD